MTSLDRFIPTKVVVLEASTSCADAARAMCEHEIGSVVVSNESGRFIGLLTDRDLTCETLAMDRTPDTRIGELASGTLIAANESSELHEVIDLMKEHGIRRVPIVRYGRGVEKCVGIITWDDLIAQHAIDLSDLRQVVASQLRPKRKARRHPVFLTESRTEAAFEAFIEGVALELDLETEAALRFVRFLLGRVYQRLHATAANSLASALPRLLEQELYEMPVGPNRSITATHLLDGVVDRLVISEGHARELIPRFWKWLRRGVGADRIDHITHQLPRDIQELLEPRRPHVFDSRPIQPYSVH